MLAITLFFIQQKLVTLYDFPRTGSDDVREESSFQWLFLIIWWTQNHCLFWGLTFSRSWLHEKSRKTDIIKNWTTILKAKKYLQIDKSNYNFYNLANTLPFGFWPFPHNCVLFKLKKSAIEFSWHECNFNAPRDVSPLFILLLLSHNVIWRRQVKF